MAVTREWIIAEIQRIATENGGKAPGQKVFANLTGIQQWDWRGRFWVKWSDALAEAGLDALEWNPRADDAALLDALAREIRRVGHFPTMAELLMRRREDATFPALRTLRRRGNKAELIGLVVAYCEQHEDDFADVLAIMRPLAASVAADTTEPPGREDKRIHGYVYLVKSGRYYKVGLSTDVQRRMLQLNTGMPQAGELVHTISTDDPAGIERYWHMRFADKRLRPDAEWFDLTADDVRAFKRRTFQ